MIDDTVIIQFTMKYCFKNILSAFLTAMSSQIICGISGDVHGTLSVRELWLKLFPELNTNTHHRII